MLRPLAFALAVIAAPLSAHALTDADRQAAIMASIDAYQACGRPCACPYNLDSRGRICGNRSAYVRPNGRHPLCYLSDIPGPEIPPIEPPDRCPAKPAM